MIYDVDKKQILESLDAFISRDENDESLWKEFWETRSNESRDRLIAFHLPLVIKIASDFSRKVTRPKSLYFGDFVSWGTLGLIFSIDHFDPSRNNQFSTYSFYCIRGFILTGIKKFAGSNVSSNKSKRTFHLDMVSIDHVDPEKASYRNLFEKMEAAEIAEICKRCLSDRERTVLDMRYTLGLTFVEIADQFDFTKQRAAQIVKFAEQKILANYKGIMEP